MSSVKWTQSVVISLFLLLSACGENIEEGDNANIAPVANTGPDQNATTLQQVQLDGSDSSDAENDPLTYAWTITGPTNSTATLNDAAIVNPTFTPERNGTYTLQLIVNDGITNSIADTLTVTSTNTPPVADAGSDQNITTLRQVQLNGSGSSDVENDPLAYAWTIDIRPEGSTANISDTTIVNPTFTPDIDGTYVLKLTVNDGVPGNSATDTITIISTPNTKPIANAGLNQNILGLQQVQLDGSGSSDAENDALTYAWILIGPTNSTATLSDATIVNPAFTPDRSGEYMLKLIVNDGLASSDPSVDSADTITVTVNTPPVADTGPDQNVITLTEVKLDGSNSSDADNSPSPITYSWSIVSKPATSNISLSSVSIANPSFIPDVDGTYVLQLIVNDGLIDSTADTIIISSIADPLYDQQWHLKNSGQNNGTRGEDINVETVWNTVINATTGTKIKGAGVNIRIIDNGLEVGHEDLAANIATGRNYDYCDSDNDLANTPAPCRNHDHGTSVAGVVAARDFNGLGVRGSAPQASIAGFNLLYNFTEANALDAITGNIANVAIVNNSWGPKDNTGELSTALNLPMPTGWLNSLQTGTTIGRGGLGTLYTWAAGNGASPLPGNPNGIDNSNYDAFANNRYVITVCATNDKGRQAVYSENGANLWICAPSGGNPGNNEQSITTTDSSGEIRGSNTNNSGNDYADKNYTKTFNGTSSAAPLAAGVIALMLQANPNLGWRDVRLILAQTARKNDPADTGWEVTAGTPVYNVNHKYGFGVIDAAAAVAASRTWRNVGPERTFNSDVRSVATSIPDNNLTGISNSIVIDSSMSIEFIEITFSANHPYHGDLRVELTSPSGTTSLLAERHSCYSPCSSDYNSWVFGSARHLGENSAGTWTLRVSDEASRDTGTFTSWGLKFYGH
ncbi:MAG: S8 family serine peptidase [Gammaproteobacteria bacterium]|nr:S8 family serine peptidase [Gammaproteobacteria bacterium]